MPKQCLMSAELVTNTADMQMLSAVLHPNLKILPSLPLM